MMFRLGLGHFITKIFLDLTNQLRTFRCDKVAYYAENWLGQNTLIPRIVSESGLIFRKEKFNPGFQEVFRIYGIQNKNIDIEKSEMNIQN